jgi:hypothetical protein
MGPVCGTVNENGLTTPLVITYLAAFKKQQQPKYHPYSKHKDERSTN